MAAADPLPPAFFPVGLNVAGRICVVIGDGEDREAIEKSQALREAGAEVRRLDPARVRDEDLAGAFLVISTPIDERLSARLRGLADRDGFLLCCIDQPAYGFVAMQAVASAGPVRIAISTGGVAPGAAKRLREALQDAMDERFVRFFDALRNLRLRNRAEDLTSEGRRDAMREAVEGFEVRIGMTYPDWFEEKGSHGLR